MCHIFSRFTPPPRDYEINGVDLCVIIARFPMIVGRWLYYTHKVCYYLIRLSDYSKKKVERRNGSHNLIVLKQINWCNLLLDVRARMCACRRTINMEISLEDCKAHFDVAISRMGDYCRRI